MLIDSCVVLLLLKNICLYHESKAQQVQSQTTNYEEITHEHLKTFFYNGLSLVTWLLISGHKQTFHLPKHIV